MEAYMKKKLAFLSVCYVPSTLLGILYLDTSHSVGSNWTPLSCPLHSPHKNNLFFYISSYQGGRMDTPQNLVWMLRLMMPHTLPKGCGKYSSHNETFYGRAEQVPELVPPKSLSEQGKEAGFGIVLWLGGETETEMRVPKGGNTQTFLSACPDVGGKGKRSSETWKLSAVKHPRWSQTLKFSISVVGTNTYLIIKLLPISS